MDFANLVKGALHKVNPKGRSLRKYLSIAHLAVTTAIRKGLQPKEEDKQRIVHFQKAIADYNEEDTLKKAANLTRFPQGATTAPLAPLQTGRQPTTRVNTSQQAPTASGTRGLQPTGSVKRATPDGHTSYRR